MAYIAGIQIFLKIFGRLKIQTQENLRHSQSFYYILLLKESSVLVTLALTCVLVDIRTASASSSGQIRF